MKLDRLGKDLSKSPGRTGLLGVVNVLQPDRDIALELDKAALVDEVDAARSCIVRDRFFGIRDHASASLLPQCLQIHLILDIPKEVGLLADPTLEGVLKLLALLEDRFDLRLLRRRINAMARHKDMAIPVSYPADFVNIEFGFGSLVKG